MGDRIVVMNDGAVQQNDAPLVLYNEPVNSVRGRISRQSADEFHFWKAESRTETSFAFVKTEGGTIEVALRGG